MSSDVWEVQELGQHGLPPSVVLVVGVKWQNSFIFLGLFPTSFPEGVLVIIISFLRVVVGLSVVMMREEGSSGASK